MKYKKLFLCLPFIISFANAQLLINEVSNACDPSIIADDSSKAQDWIEIFNPTGFSINLSGFYLTDNASQPGKWQMPSQNILPGQFTLFFCSGENRVNGAFIHTNFKIDRGGEMVFLSNGTLLLDSLNPGLLQNNHSKGRTTNGAPGYSFFSVPTPGLSNNTSSGFNSYAAEPTFSVASGFYPVSQNLTLTSAGNSIYYTIDGSDPTIASTLYTTPIPISVSMVIKAKSFGGAGTLPSAAVTKSIFINETGLGSLPVFSISLDPSDFNDIYNNTQYWNDYYPEHIGHIEYFTPSLNFETESDIDLKLHGTTSSYFNPQKGLRINCRPYYNNPQFNEVFFPGDKPNVNVFKGFNLRMDYQGGGMWDAYATNVSRSMNIDYLACRPSMVFVNGQFWGEYQLREMGDDHFVSANYPGVDNDSLDLLSHSYDWLTGYNGIKIVKGSDTSFFNSLAVITAMSPNTQGFYDYFSSKFDRSNFFDYLIAETYVGNTDWMGMNQGLLNNIKLWRKWGPEGKWRYILYDCDYSIGIQTPTTDVFGLLFNPVPNGFHGKIFAQCMQNTVLKNYFVNRYADMMNTIYQPILANEVVHDFHDTLSAAMPRHLARWGSITYQQWEDNLNYYLIGNSGPRITELRNQLQNWFTLTGQVNVTFEVYPPGAGSVSLNTINPQIYPWSGIYFNGVPIDISPLANSGWQFDHWSSTTLGAINTNDSISVNIPANEVIELHFVPFLSDNNPFDNKFVTVFPNPFSDYIYFKTSGNFLPVKAEIFSIEGKKIQVPETEFFGNLIWGINLSLLQEGIYLIKITNEKGEMISKLINKE